MTEKRYLLKYDDYETSGGDIIEIEPYYIDTKGEYIDDDYLAIDGHPTMSDKQVVDLLNEQEERIEELKIRNRRQYDLLKKLSDLMYKRDWKALEGIVEDWEESDRLLQAEWGNCGDVK